MQRIAGLEELETDANVAFLRDRFMPMEDDATAAEHFRVSVARLRSRCTPTLMTKINWTAHIMAHR